MNVGLKKILVVDDDSANLIMIDGVLRGSYKVYPVTSGADALEFLEMQTPDLILLDVEMPEMSGPELLRAIKDKPELSEIPIIFLTGLNDMDSEAAAFKMGVSDFVRKPVNDVIMLARVKMHLELAEYRKRAENP